MKTVDLSEKMKEQEEAAKFSAESFSATKRKRRASRKSGSSSARQAAEIDKLFSEDEESLVDEDLQKINRPLIGDKTDSIIKKAVLLFLFVIIVGFAYFYFQKPETPKSQAPVSTSSTGWYAVKLTNGETYYGQISDLGTDPVIVKNVYYNYDQTSPSSEGSASESKNLRLVKRGEEVHGPDGSLSVVRSQVVYMEPMKEDSKVLQAILKNEQ